jgi:anti-sigma-K factor RskA
MSSNDNDHFDSLNEQAAFYVVGTLDLNQRAAFEKRLANDDEAKRALDYWQTRLEPLDELNDPMDASPLTYQRIARSIDVLTPFKTGSSHSQTNVDSSIRREDQKTLRSKTLWQMASAALFIICISTFFFRPVVPNTIVVLTAPGQTEPGWMITSNSGQLRLKPLVAIDVPKDKVLEFWTKAEGWDKPVSLGLVDPDKELQKQLGDLSKISQNQLFELTIEQAGGSPTGLPTGPIQYIGRAVTGI